VGDGGTGSGPGGTGAGGSGRGVGVTVRVMLGSYPERTNGAPEGAPFAEEEGSRVVRKVEGIR
jgi:hypothetical protein